MDCSSCESRDFHLTVNGLDSVFHRGVDDSRFSFTLKTFRSSVEDLWLWGKSSGSFVVLVLLKCRASFVNCQYDVMHDPDLGRALRWMIVGFENAECVLVFLSVFFPDLGFAMHSSASNGFPLGFSQSCLISLRFNYEGFSFTLKTFRSSVEDLRLWEKSSRSFVVLVLLKYRASFVNCQYDVMHDPDLGEEGSRDMEDPQTE
ncbi:hypothetical protein ZIOFF_024543 [Zingiber officinale]|uniref:Uncharacterized protein n=1 Tax=Zingiber officinale TaxID=94328 RepID=A0A8J5H2I9_ZINOF|nr:hypothetical protein ZIOFF_024543 [Zingiber officinale]